MLYLALLTVGVIALINILFPILIIPCFFKLTDLEEGELKAAIFKEAQKTNVPVAQIKVIDGSTRTSHSNAFVSGFLFARKVVIFDTLIDKFPNEEILGVVCHELGHVAHSHIVWNMVSSSLQITVMFSVFALCIGN